MVTGDHPVTAAAIAREVGIISCSTAEDLAEHEGLTQRGDTTFEDLSKEVQLRLYAAAGARVVTGKMLANMTSDELDRILAKDQLVFARCV
jgi:sodium/potassium-transporting ATPase subunit alpha